MATAQPRNRATAQPRNRAISGISSVVPHVSRRRSANLFNRCQTLRSDPPMNLNDAIEDGFSASTQRRRERGVALNGTLEKNTQKVMPDLSVKLCVPVRSPRLCFKARSGQESMLPATRREKRWRATAIHDARRLPGTHELREASWTAPALWRFGAWTAAKQNDLQNQPGRTGLQRTNQNNKTEN